MLTLYSKFLKRHEALIEIEGLTSTRDTVSGFFSALLLPPVHRKARVDGEY